MSENAATDTPQTTDHAVHRDWERLLLGDNGISGTVRMIAYIVVFALVFGTLFSFFG